VFNAGQHDNKFKSKVDWDIIWEEDFGGATSVEYRATKLRTLLLEPFMN